MAKDSFRPPWPRPALTPVNQSCHCPEGDAPEFRPAPCPSWFRVLSDSAKRVASPLGPRHTLAVPNTSSAQAMGNDLWNPALSRRTAWPCLGWSWIGALAVTLSGSGNTAWAEPGPPPNLPDLEREYANHVRPVVQEYCVTCHSTEKQKGDLDLERFATFRDVLQQPKPWQQVVEQSTLGRCRPKGSQPPARPSGTGS